MAWRTFFDAVIMVEVKMTPASPAKRCRLPCRGVDATGRAIRGAAVARARAIQGMEHGHVVFMPWERALLPLQEGTRTRRRFDRCLRLSAAAITAGPLLAISTIAPPPAAD
jgi:hypothetical protein